MLTSPQRRLLIEGDIDNRELERQIAAEDGDEEAQSKELVMKMRNGILTQDQVKLLSYLSYKPAQQLIPTEPPNDLKEFVDGLEPWGREVLVKAAIVSASSVLHVFEDEHPDDNHPREAIESAISRNSADTAYAAANAASDAANAASSYAAYAAANAAAYAARAVAKVANHANTGDWAAYWNAYHAANWANGAVHSLDIRGIIEKEIIDWTLNEH